MRRSMLLAAGLLLAAAPALAAGKTELVLAIGGEPEQGYDPTLGWGRYGHPLFQSTLLERDADLATRNDLATSTSLSTDQRTWTVTLRLGVRFSDGSPLTAEDVAFTFNQAAKAGGVADMTVLAGARAVDPGTVELTLKEPRITFVENFYALGIVPAKAYGPGYARRPVGSGPYRLVRWDEGEQLIVEANPYYDRARLPFQRLTFLFTGEDTSFAAARAGEVDLAAVPASLADKVPAGMKAVTVRSVDNRGLMFPTVPDTGRRTDKGDPIGNAVTADPAIRHAIDAAIDRDGLVQGVLRGHGRPAFGPADGLPWSNPDGHLEPGGPAAAAAILDAAGWRDTDGDGVRDKDGRAAAFTVLYPASDSTRQALALSVADMLRPLGIAATPAGLGWDEIGRRMHRDVVVFGWGSHDPLEVYYLYASRFAGSDYYNAGYYANARVDAQFDAAQNAASADAAMPHWRAAEWDGETGYGMRGDAAWAWLVNLDHVYLVASCLDVGRPQVEPHGHGWPITAGILGWRWTCPS